MHTTTPDGTTSSSADNRVTRAMVIAVSRVPQGGGDAIPISSAGANRKKSNLNAISRFAGRSGAGLTKQQQQQEHSARMSMIKPVDVAILGGAGSGSIYAGARGYAAHPPPRQHPAASLSPEQQRRLRRLHEQCSAARKDATRCTKMDPTSVLGLHKSAGELVSPARRHRAKHKVAPDASSELLVGRCRACIQILEQCARDRSELELDGQDGGELSTSPDSHDHDVANNDNGAPAGIASATDANCDLVFGLFHSVERVYDLDSIYKRKLLPEMELLRVSVGGTVFEQGDIQGKSFLILSGEVYLKSMDVGATAGAGIFGIGDVIGSIAREERKMTAMCLEATTLVCLDSERIATVVNHEGNKERVTKKAFLKCVPVMSSLCDRDLNRLEGLFTCMSFTEHQVICREGTRADHIYVVKRGFFRLLKAFLPQRSTSCTGEDKTATKVYPRGRGDDTCGALKHFDLGELGPKDMLGESGFFSLPDSIGSVTEIFGAAQPVLGLVGKSDAVSSSPSVGPEASGNTNIPTSATATSEAVATISTTLYEEQSSNQATQTSARALRVRQQRGNFVVSAVASRGGAQAYVASILDLKSLLNDCPNFQKCLETARKIQQARVRAWDAQVLAEQLQRQEVWDADKRDIVLGTFKLDRLKHKLEAGPQAVVGTIDANEMAKSVRAANTEYSP